MKCKEIFVNFLLIFLKRLLHRHYNYVWTLQKSKVITDFAKRGCICCIIILIDVLFYTKIFCTKEKINYIGNKNNIIYEGIYEILIIK